MYAPDAIPRLGMLAPGEVFGGAERQLLTLSRFLVEQGHAVEAFLTYDRLLASELRASGVNTHIVPLNRRLDLSYTKRLEDMVMSRGIECLHIHGYQMAFFAARSARLRDLPVVKTEHGLPETHDLPFAPRLKLSGYRTLEQWAAKRLNATIVYVTEDLRNQSAPSHNGLTTRVIHNGIAPVETRLLSRPEPLNAPGPHLVAIGRLEKVKGLNSLIEALARPEISNTFSLHIVGAGPELPHLRAQAQALGLESRVHFPGFSSTPLSYIGFADALMIPSLHEGLPYVLLEAMSLGTPVLASDVGGMREVLQHEESALLFPPRDAAAIAASINRLFADAPLKARLVENAEQIVSSQYSAQHMGEAYVSLYRAVSPRAPARARSRQQRARESLVHHVSFPLWEWRDGGERQREFERLRQSQHFPLAELQALQLQRLQKLVRHAFRHCTFYRERWMTAPHINSLADLPKLGSLSKADIRARGEHLIADDVKRASLVEARTGGSTGVSLKVYFDHECQQWRNAASRRSDAWAGWRPGQLMAALWGSPPTPTTFKERLRNATHEQVMYLDTMRLTDEHMRAFVEEMQRRGAAVLFGHAHSLFVLARFVLDQSLQVGPLDAIVSTSMMLLEPERAVIERAFGCRVSNRYGCEEVGLIAAECEHHTGLHINAEHVIVEVLRHDGTPASPGEEGEIVVTDLMNLAMPLIRYRIEDVGVLAGRACACGRALPLLDRIVGRTADFLVHRDGSLVAGVSLVEKTLTAIGGIQQLQIVQESLNTISLNLVRDGGSAKDASRELIAVMHGVFGPETQVQVNHVERIPQERNGKFRFAICKVA